MMADLLPCPFCGGEAQLSEGISYYVFCPDCGAEGPWDDDGRDKAVNGWNARYLPKSAPHSPKTSKTTPP